ncbi:MAG: type II toxin-antitoxin system Phd/YefM family antitoxin [Planctomycetes bacterium]|nr:type II toxin-antitoxin system Phd/YefM family antitoxin [Planctomycetota bacterium]
MDITLTELKRNPGKYIDAANSEPIYITKNGKRVAKLTGTNAERVAKMETIFGIIPHDVDLKKSKLERLHDKGSL